MLNILLALAGVLLTGTQTILIALNQEAICFNEGCAVVDSLTKVPTIYFNLAGFLYFLTIFYLLLRARKGSDGWGQLAKLLLVAGMAAEGVLVAFQYFIVDIFCSYCLIIFCFIVVLNLFTGGKQFFRGLAVFAAVLVAFSVLQFSSPQKPSLDSGTYGSIAGENDGKQLVFFFSETCPHCEEVIEGIKQQNSCEIRFNPVGRLTVPPIDGIELNESYAPDVNIAFLKNIGINAIPVLMITDQEETRILKGKVRIKEYLGENCGGGLVVGASEDSSNVSESVGSSDGTMEYLFPDEDENCEVEGATDCN